MIRTRITLTLLVIVMLSACSSSPDRSDNEQRKAAETNAALGRQYMDRGQYEIALEKLKRSVGFDKTYAPAHTLLGVLYETIGEVDKAESEFRLAVKYDPEDGDVNNNLGAFLCRNGYSEEADRYFQIAVDDPFYSTPGIALANAGSCALARNDLDKAEKYLRQSLTYDNKMSAALFPLAELSYRKGTYLQARAFLQRYEAVSQLTPESLELGIAIETRLGDTERVEWYRNELWEKFPDTMQSPERENKGRQ